MNPGAAEKLLHQCRIERMQRGPTGGREHRKRHCVASGAVVTSCSGGCWPNRRAESVRRETRLTQSGRDSALFGRISSRFFAELGLSAASQGGFEVCRLVRAVVSIATASSSLVAVLVSRSPIWLAGRLVRAASTRARAASATLPSRKATAPAFFRPSRGRRRCFRLPREARRPVRPAGRWVRAVCLLVVGSSAGRIGLRAP